MENDRNTTTRASRFAANLRLLREKIPSLATTMERHRPIGDLVRQDDGQWDVLFGDVSLYNGRGNRSFSREQLANFLNRPLRSMQVPPQTANLDRHSGACIANVLASATKRGITFDAQQNGRQTFFVFVFGLGLGDFLYDLITKTGAKVVVVIEPNPDFLHYAAQVVDWAPILNLTASSQACDIRFITSSNSTAVAATMKSIIRETCPPAWDGAMFYRHYDNGLLSRIWKDFNRTASSTAMLGLGFFEDELRMISQTAENFLCGNRQVVPIAMPDKNDAPVFIIGNGPSLDHALPRLRKLCPQAIVFSCGSTLPVLLDNGIRPDCQVILERGPFQYESCSRARRIGGGLDGITLLASTTVSPRVVSLFEEVWFFFRPCLSSTPLFMAQNGHCLFHADPMAANAALNAAMAMGFQNIYLFGVDLGSRNRNADHSMTYVSPKGPNAPVDLPLELPGNFGGVVFGDAVHLWSREMMEHAVDRQGQDRNLYNASDGAQIRGFKPKHISRLSLPPLARGRERIKAKIRKFLAAYDRDDVRVRYRPDALIGEIKELIGEVKTTVAEKWDIGGPFAVRRIMSLMRLQRHDYPAGMVIRGTLILTLASLHFYANRARSNADLEEFRKISKDHFGNLLDDLCRQTEIALRE